MPSADVVVIGAGLAGLTAAITAAESGARVHVLAKGHAATHWGPGGIDVAGIPAAATARDGIRLLAAQPGHPYAFLGDDVAEALEWIRPLLAAGGAEYLGDLDTPHQLVPTSIGGTRRAAILPAGQAAARAPWAPGERLVVCGVAGFKDFWPEAIAASLSRSRAASMIRPGARRRSRRWHARSTRCRARVAAWQCPQFSGFVSTPRFSRPCRSASPQHRSRCPSSRRACRGCASTRRFARRSSGPAGASRSARWSSGSSTTGAA
jgi:hypothetical protein